MSDNKNIVTAVCAVRGEIVAMPDKNPTGNYKRHNYIVLSDVTDDTKTVVCVGLTSCKRGKWENVIPFKATNGVEGYINLNTFYSFLPSEFEDGNVHGYIRDQKVIDMLTAAYLSHMGLLEKDGATQRLNTALLEWVVTVDNTTAEVSDTSVNAEDASNAAIDKRHHRRNSKLYGKYTLYETIPYDKKRVSFPRMIFAWSDKQIESFMSDIENERYHEAAQRLTCDQPTVKKLLTKYEQCKKYKEQRKASHGKKGHGSPQKGVKHGKRAKEQQTPPTEEFKFSSNCKRYNCNYWTNDELSEFIKLFKTEDGKSVLMSEFKLTSAGLIKRHAEVVQHARKRKSMGTGDFDLSDDPSV